ncbi:MAG: DUF6036 family nucleotidyltransferase [Verrucomicrobiota bacterium]
MISNAERILRELDGHLDHEVTLVLYGRSAIALGFANAPEATKRSLDVDAIIPMTAVEAFRADLKFWDAQEATNRALEKEGLYITHLFEAKEVFLRRDWEKTLVPITSLPLRWLRLFRPATLDLVLTKMMRGDDAQDMQDIAFLIEQEKITASQLEAAFDDVVIPDLVEYWDAFKTAKPRALEIAKRFDS